MFPPPLRGRAREGGKPRVRCAWYPLPPNLPRKGEGSPAGERTSQDAPPAQGMTTAGVRLPANHSHSHQLWRRCNIVAQGEGDDCALRLGPGRVLDEQKACDLVGAWLDLAAIVVTHDLAVARLLSHRVMVMKGGRVIETGLTDQVLDDPREPYTQLLVSSILPA